VREYWIVDPDRKTVEVLSWTESGYRTEAVVPATGTLSSALFPGLNLDLAEIF
jgi:Uma2 family endonuclease